MIRFGKRTIGSTRLWFPSLRSVASHLGALFRTLEGHCRSGRLTAGKDLYFLDGSLSLQRGSATFISYFFVFEKQR